MTQDDSGELSAADVTGFHFFNGEACIKKWSPELAAALAEKGVHKVRIDRWDLPGLEPLVQFRDQITRVRVACEVSDVSALSQFSELRELSLLEGVDQLDFAQLNQLERLYVSGDTPEFGNLVACRSLEILSITDCGLRDLTPLAGMALLRELEISEAPLKSLEGIAGLTSLRRLVLSQLPLERLDGVEKLRGLDEVGLWFLRRLRSIGTLIELPLKTLVIDSCGKVSDVEKLGEVTTLESLVLDGIKLPSVTFLAGLTRLRLLKLVNAGKISSLAFLRNMRALEIFIPALNTTIEDGDMSILLELPALKQTLYTERRHYKPRGDEIKAAISARLDAK
jgi:Leucine-rich repeat (LRR) protein